MARSRARDAAFEVGEPRLRAFSSRSRSRLLGAFALAGLVVGRGRCRPGACVACAGLARRGRGAPCRRDLRACAAFAAAGRAPLGGWAGQAPRGAPCRHRNSA